KACALLCVPPLPLGCELGAAAATAVPAARAATARPTLALVLAMLATPPSTDILSFPPVRTVARRWPQPSLRSRRQRLSRAQRHTQSCNNLVPAVCPAQRTSIAIDVVTRGLNGTWSAATNSAVSR